MKPSTRRGCRLFASLPDQYLVEPPSGTAPPGAQVVPHVWVTHKPDGWRCTGNAMPVTDPKPWPTAQEAIDKAEEVLLSWAAAWRLNG